MKIYPSACAHLQPNGLEQKHQPFRRKQAGKKPGTFGAFLADCCFWAMMCRVAVVSGGVGGGWGVGGGGVWGGMLPSLRKARTHRNTHASAHRLMHGQCWLQMLASVWRATNVHPSNAELARRVSVTRARKRPACSIVGAQCMDRGWQSLQAYLITQLLSNVFGGGIGFRLRRISAEIVGCSLLVQIFEQLNCNHAKHIGCLTISA